MKGGWIVLAAAMAAAACTGGDDTAQEMPPSGEAVGARQGPQRPPEAQAEGMWHLVDVNDTPLPAPVQQTGSCRVEVVDATLRLEADRFAFQNRIREVCENTAGVPEPVMHSAGGTYARAGDVLTLTADVGDAFSQARARADQSSMIMSEMTTDAGTATINWKFERRDAQLVPVPGTTGTGTTGSRP